MWEDHRLHKIAKWGIQTRHTYVRKVVAWYILAKNDSSVSKFVLMSYLESIIILSLTNFAVENYRKSFPISTYYLVQKLYIRGQEVGNKFGPPSTGYSKLFDLIN